MPQKTFAANKSSLFADGSSNLGGGADDHLPVGGPWNGYTFRSAVQFALDWSSVKTITSAYLRLRTSSQVHVGFSSDPDIYVARCTASWTANSSSSSSEGGSGWGTSPTVYPGPASTTTGRATKDIPASEGTDVDIDITAIVKAWAPTSIAGGGAAANYGVLLYYVASGDVTEFYSYKYGTAGSRPEIILNYTTDTPPPAPTITAPAAGSVGSSLRPTLAASCVDPDGDALEVGDVEVRKGAAVVYSSTAFAAASSTTLSHVPTADLPSGDLLVRMRARAAGVYGAWSADSAFTIDRGPTTNTPTAPTGNVSGNRRPPIIFTASDPDSDPIEVYDVEVYATSAGVPTGSPVYSKTSQTAGISGYTVTHTPTADLPPGPLQTRARVRARGVWSGWSGYKAFTIVTANPSISWVWPPTPGGPFLFFTPHPAPGTAWTKAQARVQAEATAPAGYTLSTFTRKLERLDGPGAPYIFVNSADPGAVGQTTYLTSVPWTLDAMASGALFRALTCTVEITLTATSSNGGSTTEVRRARMSLLEYQGAIYLGDNVTALTIEEAPSPGGISPPADMQSSWYRAQSSKTAANGAAPWRDKSQVSTIRGELPAQGAYLGVYNRTLRTADDVDLLGGTGSFEDSKLPGWRPPGSINAVSIAFAGAPDGSRILRITGTGTNWPSLVSLDYPVVPGCTYVLTGTAKRAAGTMNGIMRVDLAGPGGSRPYQAQTTFTAGTFATLSGSFTVPDDGLWTIAKVLVFINGAPANSTEAWDFDAVTLIGPPGNYGMDLVKVNWTSAG